MNVIIRLQNLPWSANATDIRGFFKGLSIPEGGVHIIGGENGDAFIAFSTDEDARQAMQLTGGKVREVQVSLLLSSRAEMQKVIEKARQASVPTAFVKQTVASTVPKPQAIINTAPKMNVSQYQASKMPEAMSLSAPVKERSVNRDPRSRRSSSRERSRRSNSRDKYMNNHNNANDRGDSRDQYRKSRRSRSNSRERNYYNDNDSKTNISPTEKKRRTRFSNIEGQGAQASVNIMAPTLTLQSASLMPAAKTLTNGIWDIPPPQIFAKQSFEVKHNNDINNSPVYNTYGAYKNSQKELSLNQYQTVEDKRKLNVAAFTTGYSGQTGFGNIGQCVKISNVDSEIYYSDIRKFFAGLAIGPNDIKYVNDDYGNKTGIVLIRFLSSDSKKQALTKNGWQLKNNQVMITSISELDYDKAQDNAKAIRQPGSNNVGHGSAEYKVLIIDDLPRSAVEKDIIEAFPKIVTLSIDRYQAHAKFETHEAAKETLEDRCSQFIRNKRVFLEPGSEAQFVHITRKFGKYDNYDMKPKKDKSPAANVVIDDDDLQIVEDTDDRMDNDESTKDDNTEQKPQINRDPRKAQGDSRDPRQRNNTERFNNKRDISSSNNSNSNQNVIPMPKTDCIIIKNLELNATIEDVEDFFKDIGISQMRVHILLNRRGQPCGDCFVEFKSSNDAVQAIEKNGKFFGENRVQIMLIPREQVEAVLNSFGGGGGGGGSGGAGGAGGNGNGSDQQSRGSGSNGGNSRDAWDNDGWPPNDFGKPGCVVLLSNVCYRTSAEDIIFELREFNLEPSQILRRFNDLGQPTGNACINFSSPDEAHEAIDKKNKCKITNRTIYMKKLM
ncbi:unnamed protein product [Diamesa serratosioi]